MAVLIRFTRLEVHDRSNSRYAYSSDRNSKQGTLSHSLPTGSERDCTASFGRILLPHTDDEETNNPTERTSNCKFSTSISEWPDTRTRKLIA